MTRRQAIPPCALRSAIAATHPAFCTFGSATPNASSAAGPAMSVMNTTSLIVLSVTPLAEPGGEVQPVCSPPDVEPVAPAVPVKPLVPAEAPLVPVAADAPVVPLVPAAPVEEKPVLAP